jgi:hypothetical protein
LKFRPHTLNHKIRKNADGSLNINHIIEVGEKLLLELTPTLKSDERINRILESRKITLNDGIDYFTITKSDIFSIMICLLENKKK